MIGLKYVGDHEEGIRVQLFRSYKTVLLRKYLPYAFKDTEDTSREAENYYKKLRKLGVETTDDPDDLIIKGTRRNPPKRVQVPEALIDIPKPEDQVNEPETPVVDSPANDATEVTNAPEDNTPEGVQIPDLDNETLNEMSESELSEYLDMNFDRDQIKELIDKCEMDITPGRKGKSTLISEIMESYKDRVLEYLAK